MSKKEPPTFIADTPTPAAGFGPRKSVLGLDDDEDAEDLELTDDDMSDADEDEYLYDYAMEYLPRLPQLDRLLESVSLDYSVLVSARIAAEELSGMTDAALDDLLTALILAGEGDEEVQAALYETLSAAAQQNLMDLHDIMNAENETDISEAPLAARLMLMAGALADVEVIDELIEEEEEAVEFEEMEITGKVMAALTEKGGIAAALMTRAVASFNLVAGKTQTPLALRQEGDSIHLDDQRPPSSGKKPPRP